ncbi:DUF3783 domain-containing protein [Clostridium sp. UBA4548]|uniref:DUF3783 domain-containing protein n=1 Tax=Clostridium sp. UBA4548 TaxID=1946361 RepID=UPI0025C18D11|nr:DUF3783 domain-containing protein [Clostridium sp. UBA4548]
MNLLDKKVILTFALDLEEIDTLNSHFEKQGAKPCVIIENSMADKTLEEILEDNETTEVKREEPLPKEKIVIFNGFDDGTLQRAVTEVRTILSSRPILATVTPISMTMKFKDLLEHLVEEREFHRQNSKKKN